MDAAKTLQGTPYCDCLVIFDPESDRSVEMAGVWSEAARNLGAIPVCRPLEDLEAGARISVGEKKEDPLDFALWKARKTARRLSICFLIS